MRTFIAVHIPSTRDLKDLYSQLHLLTGLTIKITGLENLHVTLAFLGETSNDQVNNICSGLKSIPQVQEPIKLELYGLGVFKHILNPQTLWIGIKPNRAFHNLKNAVNRVTAEQFFLPNPREFAPHLTIGRIKTASKDNNLSQFIKNYENVMFGDIEIRDFVFYKSVLTPGGPVYTPLDKFSVMS